MYNSETQQKYIADYNKLYTNDCNNFYLFIYDINNIVENSNGKHICSITILN